MNGIGVASLQDELTPDGTCFGCGPANEDGLRLKSYRQADGTVVATFMPDPHYQAGPGILCGGIVGTLLDCHAGITAVVALEPWSPAEELFMVTKEFTVRLKGVTPIAPFAITAQAVEHDHRRATVHAAIQSDGQVTAEFEGVFVAPRRPR